ncbi:MAG TPA: 4Fe-4S dicluster domain-containing protein [Sphaerochaeta sp.]|nr:4Fe-4S dicluster domain-containing protein [Sphaerochaeta sp.]
MKKVVQRSIQVLFLAFFVVLAINGKIQMWMGIFVLSALASLIFSRFYCGWLCPINTVLKPLTWTKKKLHIKSFKVPAFLKKAWVRIGMLVLFLGILAFTLKTGKKLPVLPISVALGFVLTLFFPEELWHRHLCPYGVILSLPSRKAMYGMKIDQDTCIKCGKCSKVCPSAAITKEEKKYSITKNECLVCRACAEVCPVDAITYHK